jgi:hypothetical protein
MYLIAISIKVSLVVSVSNEYIGHTLSDKLSRMTTSVKDSQIYLYNFYVLWYNISNKKGGL